jgi:hypothetical protein
MRRNITVWFIWVMIIQISGQGVDSIQQAALKNNKFDPITDTIYTGTLFEQNFPLTITLISDFTAFAKPKNYDKYLSAELIVHLPNNDSIVKNIRLKTRGKSRKEMCNFPPIKLNFKKDPIKHPDYKGINKMKMVTHCKGSKIFNDYTLKEFLTYKLYNAITDYSLKVRLLKIDYLDTGKKGLNQSRYGFVIEPIEAMAARVNAVQIETKVVAYSELDKLSSDRVALFNYMVGNTDYQFKTSHNLKFIKILDINVPGAQVIPYDFDYSGFINTHYSMPQEWSYVETVTDRDYMGFCRPTEDNFNKLKEEFLAAEDSVYETIMNFEHLTIKERQRLKWYIEAFYKDLKSKQAYRIITSNCREPY